MPTDPVEIAREEAKMLAGGIDYGCGCSMDTRYHWPCAECCMRAVRVARALLASHEEAERLRGLLGECWQWFDSYPIDDSTGEFDEFLPRIAAELRKETKL